MILNTRDLKNKLNLIKCFIDARSCIATFSSAFLEDAGDGVCISTFGNDDIMTRFEVEFDSYIPGEQVILPCESFDLIKSIASETVRLTYTKSENPHIGYLEIEEIEDGSNISVKAKIPVFVDSDDIPDSSDTILKAKSKVASCDGKKLSQIIRSMVSLIDKSYTKPLSNKGIYSGIHLEYNHKGADVVVTDLHYIVKREMPDDLFEFSDTTDTSSVDVPYTVVKFLSKLEYKYEGKISIFSDDKKQRIRLEFNDKTLQGDISFSVPETKFLDYKSLFVFDKSTYGNRIIVDRKKFKDAIKRIRSSSKIIKAQSRAQKSVCVKMDVLGMEMKLTALINNSETVISTSIPLSRNDHPEEPYVMGFSVDYLDKILSYFSYDLMLFIYLPTEPTGGMGIKPRREESYAFILPVKL